MIAHVGFTVSDIAKAKQQYGKALAPLGMTVVMSGEGYAAFGSSESVELWLGEPNERHQVVATDVHVCFVAPSRAAVDLFYHEGVSAGFADNGAPGVREHYGLNYYAAFIIDNDGNNIEAVCFGD